MFNEGEKIKVEFEEYCEFISFRCMDVMEKVIKLDNILDEVRREEEKVFWFMELV